jgi:hypothetical protein
VDEPTPDDVEQIVREAQRLDQTKQRILADLRAQGTDPDDVRVIVSYPTESGEYRAVELMTPRWSAGKRRQQPDSED